jgi:hypothetical protein
MAVMQRLSHSREWQELFVITALKVLFHTR